MARLSPAATAHCRRCENLAYLHMAQPPDALGSVKAVWVPLLGGLIFLVLFFGIVLAKVGITPAAIFIGK